MITDKDLSPEEPDGVPHHLPLSPARALLLRDPIQVTTLMHADLRLATTQVMAELFNRQTLVVVVGEAGLGKTLLLHEVGRTLRAAQWQVADETQVASIIARPVPGPVAVLIDGADHVSPRQMQYLRQQPNLAVVLALPDMPDPRIPFCAPIRLKPMSALASAQFVAAWFEQTGTKPNLLDREGIARLIELCRGVPRNLASLLHELAQPTNLSAKPFSRTNIDETARRSGLSGNACVALENNLPKTRAGFKAEPYPEVAFQSLEPDQDQAPAAGFRRLLPINPGSAALTGLLCGIGAAILGLLTQNLLTNTRDKAADDRAAHVTSASPPSYTRPNDGPRPENAFGLPFRAREETP